MLWWICFYRSKGLNTLDFIVLSTSAFRLALSCNIRPAFLAI